MGCGWWWRIEEGDFQATGPIISYGSAVARGAFPSVDLFALPILTSPKCLLSGIRNNRKLWSSHRAGSPSPAERVRWPSWNSIDREDFETAIAHRTNQPPLLLSLASTAVSGCKLRTIPLNRLLRTRAHCSSFSWLRREIGTRCRYDRS